MATGEQTAQACVKAWFRKPSPEEARSSVGCDLRVNRVPADEPIERPMTFLDDAQSSAKHCVVETVDPHALNGKIGC
jgi:hypothetical protein